jgi:hypothetical protein
MKERLGRRNALKVMCNDDDYDNYVSGGRGQDACLVIRGLGVRC